MSEEAFERYLRGNLNPEERNELEGRLAEDADFAKKFEEEKLVWQTREVLLEDQLRKDLTDLNGSTSPKNWLKMAMGLMIIAGAVILLLLNYHRQPSGNEQNENENPVIETEQVPAEDKMEPKIVPKEEQTKDAPKEIEKSRERKTNTQFAMELYGNGPNWSQMRGSGDLLDSVQLAVAAYLAGNYADCLLILDRKNPGTVAMLELKAHTLLHLSRYDEASKILKAIADRKQIPYYERSQWYYVLSQIAAGKWDADETEKMKKEILSDREHEYFEKFHQLESDSFFKRGERSD